MVNVTIDDLTLLAGAIADGDLIEIDRQGAPDISRKVTKINFVTDIDNADIAAGAAIATSKLADAANFVLINQANVYTAGQKQTFAHNATNAGIRINEVAGNPSALVDGDVWLNLTSNQLFCRINGVSVDLGQSGGDKTVTFPIVEIVPEESPNIGFPDIHAFATAVMKQDGWVLPDGASASTINFRGYLPPTLAAIPNMRIIVMIVTLGVVSPAGDVHLRIRGEYKNTGEDLDVAQNDVDISEDITLETTTETVTFHTFNPATDPANDDIFTFNIERDPANAGDDFTDDILIFVKGVVDI